jgi:hypothetical protein
MRDEKDSLTADRRAFWRAFANLTLFSKKKMAATISLPPPSARPHRPPGLLVAVDAVGLAAGGAAAAEGAQLVATRLLRGAVLRAAANGSTAAAAGALMATPSQAAQPLTANWGWALVGGGGGVVAKAAAGA